MIKFRLIFMLLFVSLPSEGDNWLHTKETNKKLVYIVSTKPLAELYGHPLANNLSKLYGNSAYIYTSYLSNSAGFGTSAEQLMYSVDQSIQRMDPDIIILDNIQAGRYLLDLLPDKFHSKTYQIGKGLSEITEEIRNIMRVPIKDSGTVILNLLDAMNLFPDKFYILYDSSGLAARESFVLKKTLSKVAPIQSIEISTRQQLDNFLLDINDNQRGVIINNILSLKDQELGTEVGIKQVKEIITKRNRKHLEIGFNFIPDSLNESVIIQLDYDKLAHDLYYREMEPLDYGYSVTVNKKQMRRLMLKNNYIAALNMINALAD